MALQAGRVGLNKDVVDEFGYLKNDTPTGEYYTKTQVDNKFETKTHANNTFQHKTLEVPIEMLDGTKLTVESALQGLNSFDNVIEGVITSTQSIVAEETYLKKQGVFVDVNLALYHVTAEANATIATIPQGFRPSIPISIAIDNITDKVFADAYISTDGTVHCRTALNNQSVRIKTCFIVG